MTIKYIEERAELAWRKIPDIPLIALSLRDTDGHGHVKEWLEENIQNTVYVLIDDQGDFHKFGLSGPHSEILIVFLAKED
ncbi:hypothetical protein LCGC14_1856440, partial [marine sediment metagenome]